jgi:hypothetical protein
MSGSRYRVTNLLFPYVSSNSAFGTAITISNTSADGMGTTPQAGGVILRFWGSGVPAGAAGGAGVALAIPAVSTGGTVATAGVIGPGEYASFLSSDVAPSFTGYMIATCNFEFAQGVAFIINNSVVGSANVGGSYLAPVISIGSSARGAPLPKNRKAPVEVFMAYSHKDETLRDELEKHLALLKREGSIRAWCDREIGPGEKWQEQIDERLNSADIILLLVSADFLASDYCFNIEMRTALNRADTGEARVIPIILKECDWSSAPFGGFQVLPPEAKAVTSWPNRDEAFANIVKGIREAVKRLQGDS